jgi:hypothetical protein
MDRLSGNLTPSKTSIGYKRLEGNAECQIRKCKNIENAKTSKMRKHRKCENIETEKILTLPADLKNPGKEKMTKSP